MGILQPDELYNFGPTSARKSEKIDLHKVGKDIYELLVHPGHRSYKQRARKQTVELKPDKRYTPSEIAALLNVSYDTAVRRMQTMKGCVDMGTQTKRYKRGKKMLRISGKHLVAYIAKFEQDLDARGDFVPFKGTYLRTTGTEWERDREAIATARKAAFAKAYAAHFGVSESEALTALQKRARN